MRALYTTVFGLLLAIAPPTNAAHAQTPAAQPRAEHPRQIHGPRPGLEMLLRHRAELQLSDAQITRLESIAAQLQERNRPLLEQLREAGIPIRRERREEVREMTQEQRRALHDKLVEHRPVLEQLRKNTHAAMVEAREVLTPEQQKQLRELTRQHQDDNRRRGEPERRSGVGSRRGT